MEAISVTWREHLPSVLIALIYPIGRFLPSYNASMPNSVSDLDSLNTDPPVTRLDAQTLRRGAADLGLVIEQSQVCMFQRYYHTLLEWNSRMNLTAVTGWEQVQRRHFLDSLSLSTVIEANKLEVCRFIDVGSGAGLPGIPMKIAFPCMTGTLLDATGKKVQFLRHVVDTLSLSGLEARHGRAEELARLPELREQFDLVVSRAVAPMSVLAELTLPFCRPGGFVAVHKTSTAADEIEEARHAIHTLGGEVREPFKFDLDDSESSRLLLVVAKVDLTPERYPRRSGIPSKRPLSNQ